MNFCMIVSYDGSRFAGWQKNDNTGAKRALQTVFEQMLSAYFGQEVRVKAAGRTDAGVHAIGQALHFHVHGRLPEEFAAHAVNESAGTGSGGIPAGRESAGTGGGNFMPCHEQAQEEAYALREKPDGEQCRRLNAALRQSLRREEAGAAVIRSVRAVPECFHSRFDAVGKTYDYYFDERERESVFARAYAYPAGGRLDLGAMKAAARYLIGTHDFSMFSSVRGGGKETVRTIHAIQIERIKREHPLCELVRLSVTGDGFLYHMMRILAGTLYEAGIGKRTVQSIKEALDGGVRADTGILLPGSALFLREIYYKEEDICGKNGGRMDKN